MRLRRRNMKIQSLFTPQMNTHEHDDRTRKGRRKKKRSQVRGLLHLLGRLEEPVLLPLLQPSRRRHGAQPPPQQQPQIKSRTSHQPPSRLATPTPQLVGLQPKTGAQSRTRGKPEEEEEEGSRPTNARRIEEEAVQGKKEEGAAFSWCFCCRRLLRCRRLASPRPPLLRGGEERRRESGKRGRGRREVNYSLSLSLSRLLLLLPSVSVSLVFVVVVFLSLSDSGAFFGIPVSLPAAAFLIFF